MSKTDGVILNSIGWQLDDDPLPMLYIGPTRKNTESISTDRVKKMISSVPSLDQGLAKGKKDKITEKFINGVRLGFGWAGSATELASHPAAKVFIDERDRMGTDVEGEGDVNTLADARTATYDGCVVTTSTPLIGTVETYIHDASGLAHWGDGENMGSPSWAMWQEGTRHEWAWPCPSCNEYYIPRFKLLWWPEKSSPKQAFRKAMITCPHCGAMSNNSQKEQQNLYGVFLAPGQKAKRHEEGDTAAVIINPDGKEYVSSYGGYVLVDDEAVDISFWASGLCSNWRSYGHRARTFLNAVQSGEPGRIQAAINTGFGELYHLAAEGQSWQLVAGHKKPYKSGEVPKGVQRILLTIDVQKNRLEYVLRGWGVDRESWKIESGELYGDTDKDEVWNDLQKFREKKYTDIGIDKCLIDSGYRTDFVYDFCRKNPGWAFPVKGHDSQEKPIKVARIEVNIRGRSERMGLQLIHMDSDYFKSWVHGRLERSDDMPGGWHLPEDTTEDYCKQIVAETKVPKPSGRSVWVVLKKNNHKLDCEAMQAAGAEWLKYHQIITNSEPEPPTPNPQNSQSGWVRRGGGGWMNRR